MSFAYFLGGNCRYYPSCSHYAAECFEKHSFFTASKLTILRLASCHPFSRKSSYDPVPMTNQERSLYE
ncbi:MAG: membrane protein insertion efficiency factor YidD [Bdellovibrionaceae bacterium]|nr:membrane protein insertion efficiency factor YidD [Pseudobdellovibrionaceae bacterium]